MASAIESIIDELEEYIDSCKPAAFSSTKIVVNRDDIDGLLEELRAKTPEEIRRYQKIISNKEAILADAKNKAESIVAEAQITKNELVSEHQIMQQAYAQANEVVMIATKQAQEILDNATNDANDIRTGAISYTDELLKSIQDIVRSSIDTTKARTDTFLSTMQGYLDVVTSNRAELNPSSAEDESSTKTTDKAASEKTAAEKSDAKSPAADSTTDDKKSGAAANKTEPQKPSVSSGSASATEVKKSDAAADEPGQTVLNIPDEFFK